VKKLAVELYLAPKQEPDVATLDLPLARLARKWLLRGVLGRKTRKAAERALDAAEQLALEHVLVRRRQADSPSRLRGGVPYRRAVVPWQSAFT